MPNLSTWENGDGLVQRYGRLATTARPTQMPQLFDYAVFRQPERYQSKRFIASEYPLYGYQASGLIGGTDLRRLTDSAIVVDTTAKVTGTWNVRKNGSLLQITNTAPTANDIVAIGEGYTLESGGPVYTETFSTSTTIDFRRRMYFAGRIQMSAATASANLYATAGFGSVIGEANTSTTDGIYLLFTGTTAVVACSIAGGISYIENIFTVSGMNAVGAPLLVEAMWEPESATFSSRVVDGAGTEQFLASSPNTALNPKAQTTASVGFVFSHRATTTTASAVGLDYVMIATER